MLTYWHDRNFPLITKGMITPAYGQSKDRMYTKKERRCVYTERAGLSPALLYNSSPQFYLRLLTFTRAKNSGRISVIL